MALTEALPFLVAPLPQFFAIPMQILIGRDFQTETEDSSDDAACNIPSHSPESLRQRLFRDVDAMAAVAYSATIIPAGVALLDPHSALFGAVVALAVLFPVTMGISIHLVASYKYARLSKGLNGYLSPYLVLSTLVSLAIAICALNIDATQ